MSTPTLLPFPESLRAGVLVLGGGPAGAITALRLRQLGVGDVLILDARDFPRDKTCGSGLSPALIGVLRELGVWSRVAEVAYPIEGMRLTTPGGHEVDLPARGLEVGVCLRRDLDHVLLQAAIDAGARFVPGFRGKDLVEEDGRVVGVRTRDGREARGRFTVIATGAHAPLAIEPERKRTIHTMMGWWTGLAFRPHWMEMIYDADLLPYYGWLFPETPERVNIGITYVNDGEKRNARETFDRFLDRHYADRLQGAEEVWPRRGHPIVWSYQVPKLATPGRFVVGEAGRMVHPATGEGLSYAARSGILAAEALAGVLLSGHSERLARATYRARCAKAFTGPFLAGGAFMRAIRSPWTDRLVAAASDDRPALQRLTHGLFSKL